MSVEINGIEDMYLGTIILEGKSIIGNRLLVECEIGDDCKVCSEKKNYCTTCPDG